MNVEMLERMRRAREELGLDLRALEQRTRVRMHLLSAVEDGRLDELPRGVYARSVVRAYASAVGIDPNRAVTAVAALLPDLEDPLDGIARVRGFARCHEPAAPPAPSDSSADDTSRAADGIVPSGKAAAPADAATAAGSGIPAWQPARQAAALIDGLVLGSIGLGLLALTSGTAGVPMAELPAFAVPALVMLVILIAGLYFLVLGGILGATVGTHLMRIPLAHGDEPVRIETAARRACAVAAPEISILVDALLPILMGRAPGGKPSGPRSGTRWAGRAAAR